MTIGSTDVTAGPSTTNGATVEFSFSFPVADYGAVEAEDQIKVSLVTIASGVETVLTRGSNPGQYTVAINGDQASSPGGTITTISTYAAGYRVWIRTNPSYLQATSLQNQGAFNASVVEAQVDQTTRQMLDLKDQLRRAPVAGIQIGESFSGEITGTPVAGYIAALNSGLTGYQWVANNGASSTVTASGGGTELLSDWFKRMARGTDYPDVAYGYHTDRSANGDTSYPLRIQDRLFLGTAATGEEGATIASGHTVTWLSSSFDHYFARGAQLLSISPNGGAGGVFATRRSDVYDGNAVWTSGEAVVIGDKRGYVNSAGSQTLYTATTSGTTGATPPTHTTGTASDGTVTWSFTQLQYRTAMGFASLAYNNAADGGAAWGGYIEAYRAAGAGYAHGLEVDIKNGGTNVQVHPYSISTAGATDALNLAAGPTQYGPSASNPVSAAIIFQSNGSTTFNKGLVFESTSLTDEGGGVYLPLNLFVGCHIRQYASDGTTGSAIQFNGTANNERVALSLQNRAIYAYCQGAIMGGFESIPSAGTAPDNYVALSAHANSDGYVQARAAGTGTNITLSLASKGAADTHILREDSSTDTAPHVLSIRRRSTGTPATGIGATLTFDVETAADNDEIGAGIAAVTTDVTPGNEDFDLVFSLMAGGAARTELLRLTSDNKLKFQSGAVLDFASADIEITHTSNTLTLTGGTLVLGGGGATVAQAKDTTNTSAILTPSNLLNVGAMRLLWVLTGADMNSTADQALTKVGTFTNYIILIGRAVNPSLNMTTAAGGVYSATAKGGSAVLAASTVYTNLTVSTAYQGLTPNVTVGGVRSDANLYLSLTTPQGAAATADFYFWGIPLS